MCIQTDNGENSLFVGQIYFVVRDSGSAAVLEIERTCIVCMPTYQGAQLCYQSFWYQKFIKLASIFDARNLCKFLVGTGTVLVLLPVFSNLERVSLPLGVVTVVNWIINNSLWLLYVVVVDFFQWRNIKCILFAETYQTGLTELSHREKLLQSITDGTCSF